MVGLTGGRRLLRGAAVVATTTAMSLIGAPSAVAASFDVNSNADTALGGAVSCSGGAAPCTLRAAVQAADATGGASTITLPAGNYKLAIPPPSGASASDADDPATGDLDVDNGVTITLIGGGAATTEINADAVDRAFAVHTGASLTLTGLTITGGSPAAQSEGNQQGGAIYTDGRLSTGSVDFTANSSLDGGAIYADTGSRLSVNGGAFTGNGGTMASTTTEYGGAIEDASANPAEIQSAAFSRQTAYTGGGDLYFSGAGALTIADSSFDSTVSSGGGGAIFAAGGGQVTVTASRFTGDSGAYGGAIFSNDSINLTADSFTDDTAASPSVGAGGGALYMQGASATQNLIEDQFSGDSASVYGGAIYAAGGDLGMAQSSITGGESQYGGALYLGGNSTLLEDDTIAQNSAVQGGALYLSGPGPLSLVNDTIAGNTAAAHGGGGIFGAAAASPGSGAGIVNTILADNVGGDCDAVLNSSVVTGYDLDSDSTCFAGLTASGLQTGVQPALAAPANNGGEVLTMLEQPGSPTIGAGDSAYCPAADARSVARNPSSCDLGAYQAIGTGLTATDNAPASAVLDAPFAVRLTVTNAGPGIASNVTISDQLQSTATLVGQQPSVGDCTSSGSPVKVSCAMGNIAAGSTASVILFLSGDTAGTFTNAATVADDQGSSASATAQTTIVATTAKPTITRAQVRQITRSAATLRARLNPYGNAVSYFFEYGTRSKFGRITRLGVTSSAGVRSARVIGLLAGRRYYFRLVASSGSTVTYGPTYTFVTKAAPKPHRPKKARKHRKLRKHRL